jgi:hypothetical protein
VSQAQLLADASNVLVLVIFTVSVLFTPVVSLYWPWWKNDLGRSIVSKSIAMALVFLFPALHLMFDGEFRTAPYQWFELACFALVPVIFVWRAVAIWRLQRNGARGR